MPDEWWDLVLDVNLTPAPSTAFARVTLYTGSGPARARRAGQPRYNHQDRELLFDGSRVRGNPGQINHVAAKMEQRRHHSSGGAEVGALSVNCNAVAPGFTETRMTASKGR